MIKLLRNMVVAGLLGLTINTNAQTVLFSDNMENGTNGWTIDGISNGDSGIYDGGLWHLSQHWSASTNTSWYYGNEITGTVGPTNSWNYGSLTTPSISLAGVTNAALTFSHFVGGDTCLPIDDDMIWVDVSTNNFETYSTPVMGLPNGSSLWGNAGEYEGPTVTVDLSEFVGQSIKIRFSASFSQSCGEHLDLSQCNPTEGYYIDDINVVGNIQ